MKKKSKVERATPRPKKSAARALAVGAGSPLPVRKYWAHLVHVKEGRMVLCDRTRAFPKSYVRVALVPLNKATLQRLADKMAEAFNGSYDGHLHALDLRAMLRAIGLMANTNAQPSAETPGGKHSP